jgi:hypothetical protein
VAGKPPVNIGNLLARFPHMMLEDTRELFRFCELVPGCLKFSRLKERVGLGQLRQSLANGLVRLVGRLGHHTGYQRYRNDENGVHT